LFPTFTLPAFSRFDRQLALALLLIALVVIPRSILIARDHSEAFDAEYHIERGLAYWTGTIAAKDLQLNDPPLGEALVSLPVLFTNFYEGRDPADARLYDEPGRAERLGLRCAVWCALLFLPLVAVVFLGCRRLYGLRAAWFACGMIALEPNFAAHLSVAALDAIGVTGVVVGCFLAWRYFERPTGGRLVALGVATGVGLMLKHTVVILPGVIVAFAALWWGLKPWREGVSWADWRSRLPGRLVASACCALIVAATIVILSSLERCPPRSRTSAAAAAATSAPTLRYHLEDALHFDAPWPGGVYLRAFRTGFGHGATGHPAYLFGERRQTGWWYYFPAIATYKVPIGVGVVLALGLLSLGWRRPRWDEWGIALPLVAWSLFMMNAKVNIGFRHFLPAYLFALLAATRALALPGVRWAIPSWSALALAGVHAASFHPDYISYINYPRHKPHLAISDSNVDWGQGLKQARAWLDAHPQQGRAVWLSYFGPETRDVRYYLGDRAVRLGEYEPLPTRGLLIISPVHEAGTYNPSPEYAALRAREPDAVIGHCWLVYDLDRPGARARVETRVERPRAGDEVDVVAEREKRGAVAGAQDDETKDQR
jgi:hypothetical protein